MILTPFSKLFVVANKDRLIAHHLESCKRASIRRYRCSSSGTGLKKELEGLGYKR